VRCWKNSRRAAFADRCVMECSWDKKIDMQNEESICRKMLVYSSRLLKLNDLYSPSDLGSV
jgi:hypothetical protein